jgi:alginate O-acetyltransferase complex protein AlgI
MGRAYTECCLQRDQVSYSAGRMSFVSLTFLFFLALVFAFYWACSSRIWRNSVILAASYVFYSWWDWRFSCLMLASSLVDYAAGIAIYRSRGEARRKQCLAAALSVNLGLLVFFKYFGFFVDSFAIALTTLGIDVPTISLAIILPVGISILPGPLESLRSPRASATLTQMFNFPNIG